MIRIANTVLGATIKIFRVSLCYESSAKSDFRNYSKHSIDKHTEILEVIFYGVSQK